MSKKTVDQCRSGKDFYHYGRKSPNLVGEESNGTSHVKLRTRKGVAVVAVHNGDMPKGTASALRKHFRDIGLALLLIGGAAGCYLSIIQI